MKFEKQLEQAHQNQYHLKTTMTLEDYPQIQGYDFEKEFDFKEFLKAYATTGFQATNLAEGIEIVKAMQREKAIIFLSYTLVSIFLGFFTSPNVV